jgi:hypothetical protein
MTHDPTPTAETSSEANPHDYAEFEIGQDKVPWFLWVFFAVIISWASISWMKLFGY